MDLVLGFSSGQFFSPTSAIACPLPDPGNSTALVVRKQGVLWKEHAPFIQKICVETSASFFTSYMRLGSVS